MISVSLTTLILVSIIVAGASFGMGYAMAHRLDPSADPYRYCYHVNTNETWVHQIFPWAPAGEYVICKVG